VKTIKTLEENIGGKLHDTGFGNDFLVWYSNKKIGKLGFVKNVKFCTSKDTIHRVKRQPKEGEKIFVNHISDKGLVSRIYKEHLQHSAIKTNNLI